MAKIAALLDLIYTVILVDLENKAKMMGEYCEEENGMMEEYSDDCQ